MHTSQPSSRGLRNRKAGFLGGIAHRAGLLGTLAALGLVAFLAGGGVARAQLSNNFPTTTTVPAGGELTLGVTTPGITITGVTQIPGCTTTGINTPTVVYNCSATSTGISVGTPIQQFFSATSGQVTETVTYNSNGPITGFPAAGTATAAPGNCTPPGGTPTTSTCGTQTTAATIPGGRLDLNVTAATGQTVQITAVDGGAQGPLGNCPPTTFVPTAVSPVSGIATVSWLCGPGQSIPSGTTISVTVIVVGSGNPTVTANINANAPVPATAAVPAPTTQQITVGTALPTLTSINPTTGGPGTVVTITGTNLSGVTAINFNSTPATSVVCAATGTTCTAAAPSLASGTIASVVATAPGGSSTPVTFAYTGTTGTLTNVAFISAPATGPVGQPVTFTAANATTSSSCATIQNYSFNWGDGSALQTGLSTSASHTYSAPGTYAVTLQVTDCAGNSGSAVSTITIGSGTGPGNSISYASGWNIVGGPSGTVVSGNSGPLYTYQAGNTAYQTLSTGTALTAGQGYWAFFNTATTSTIPVTSAQTISIALPALQWVMIGNPGNTPATVTGADVVYTYATGPGYQATTTLQPGQGAWAISLNGGTVTIANQ